MTENNPSSPKDKPIRKVDIYEEYINWMALPHELREPPTQELFAKKFGIHIDTTTDWKKREGFWTDVKKKRNDWAKSKTPDVINALYKKAVKEGNAAEAKLWLQYVDEWTEKQALDVESNSTIGALVGMLGIKKEDKDE